MHCNSKERRYRTTFYRTQRIITQSIRSLISSIIIGTLTGLRPLLGPAVCKYTVGCTDFAVLQLQTEPLLKALWLIAKRLLSCNPFIN